INTFFFSNQLEIYLQVVPKLGIGFLPSPAIGSPLGGWVEGDLGVRAWFGPHGNAGKRSTSKTPPPVRRQTAG
ncbi:MAG: hypothetical protein LBS64_04985, partial [Spirochaetaceae bacterium]|nr:hypothetical protein [Spirochaetaceae bacterium]